MALVGVAVWSASVARAQASAEPSAALDDRAIAEALREQGSRAHTHRYVWTAVNGALGVGSFAIMPAIAAESRKDFVVAGAGSLLSAVVTFAFPLRVETDSAELDQFEALPPAERSRKLHDLLRADADDERERLGFAWHVVNLGVSALAGGIIALGFHHTLSGVTQGVGSFALGEAQLFTQPTRLETLEAAPNSALRYLPRLSLERRTLTLGLRGTF
ncbi:MAG TPA: hypothetical protein VGM44_21290 [Polyangiaceae bacterium]|jgi:hypothetical protein